MDNEPSCKQYSPASLAMAGAAVANLSKEKALRKERTCCATGAKQTSGRKTSIAYTSKL